MSIIADNERMFQQFRAFPDLIRDGIRIGKDSNVDSFKIHEIQRVHWIGMGASALVGEFVKAFFEEKFGIEFRVSRIHKVRTFPYDFWIFYSYSGNTSETLSAFHEVSSKISSDRIITVSSGGKLEQEAKEKGVLHVKLKKGYVSRTHLPMGVAALSIILGKILEKEEEIEYELEESARLLEKEMRKMENIAEEVAQEASEKIPILVATYLFEPVLQYFEKTLNENTKRPALGMLLPEGLHNFICIFESCKDNLVAILLDWENGDSFCKAYIEAFKHIAEKLHIETHYIEMPIDDYSFATLLLPTLFVGFLSVKIANKRNIDSYETKLILEAKKVIKSFIR